MRFRRIFSWAVAAIAVGLLMTPVAEARSLDDIIKSGVLKAGVNPTQPPLSSYNNKNELEGFDIDVVHKLAEMLGVKVELIPQKSAQRVPNLAAGRTDISLGALTRNPKRLKVIDYSVPLHTESMAVLATTKLKATNVMQLNDENITLVNTRGTTPVEFVRKNLPKAKHLLLDSNANIVRAVAQGRADAIVENVDNIIAHTRKHTNVEWKVLPEVIKVAYCAIGVQRGNDGLRHWLNGALFALHSSNYINDTWAKWFGGPPAAKIVPNPFF